MQTAEVSHKILYSTCGQFESRKINVVWVFLSNSTQIFHKKHLLKYMYANYVKYIFLNELIGNVRSILTL